MKLRNKKTGEIAKIVGYVKTGDDRMFFRFEDYRGTYKKEYNSLAELNEEWEDYEEPKEYWFINEFGTPTKADFVWRETLYDKCRKNFGNYFESKEEAELAVRKLKAWKRLKDKGFHWLWYNSTPAGNSAEFYISDWDKEATRDITLLFEGEEREKLY